MLDFELAQHIQKIVPQIFESLWSMKRCGDFYFLNVYYLRAFRIKHCVDKATSIGTDSNSDHVAPPSAISNDRL